MKKERLEIKMKTKITDKLFYCFQLLWDVFFIWLNIYFATTRPAGYISSTNYVAAIIMCMLLVKTYKEYPSS